MLSLPCGKALRNYLLQEAQFFLRC